MLKLAPVHMALSSQFGGPTSPMGGDKCSDGDLSTFCHSDIHKTGPWLSIDLGGAEHIQYVVVYNRGGECCKDRLGHFQLWVGDKEGAHSRHGNRHGATLCADAGPYPEGEMTKPMAISCDAVGRFVTLLLPGDDRILNLDEWHGDLFTGWDGYRIGDMFLYSDWRAKDGPMHMQKWPNSIASQYMRATGATGDYNTMTSIIRQRGAGGNTPSPHTVVVHTRIGDVLDMDMAHVGNVDVQAVLGGYAPGKLSHYTYPLSHYQSIIGQLPGDVNHVVFCGGCQFNHGGSFPKSAQYINAVARWFLSKGFSVDYKMGRNPDDDIVYMAHAKHFFQGGGGFSTLIGGIVEHMGGQRHQ